jgi:hypothetical protein
MALNCAENIKRMLGVSDAKPICKVLGIMITIKADLPSLSLDVFIIKFPVK